MMYKKYIGAAFAILISTFSHFSRAEMYFSLNGPVLGIQADASCTFSGSWSQGGSRRLVPGEPTTADTPRGGRYSCYNLVYSPGTGATAYIDNSYVPKTGDYGVYTFICTYETTACHVSDAIWRSTGSNFTHVVKGTSMQNLKLPSNFNSMPPDTMKSGSACYALVDKSTDTLYSLHGTGWCVGSYFPPSPPPEESCDINNGAALSVDLGTMERTALATVPGTGANQKIQIPVQCKGDKNVAESMKIQYTPVTVSGTEVIKSSVNGVGVAISYNDKPLSTTDTTDLTFLPGSNTLELAFEAVRDPTVEQKDIPTGSFTANAVLVLTEL